LGGGTSGRGLKNPGEKKKKEVESGARSFLFRQTTITPRRGMKKREGYKGKAGVFRIENGDVDEST